MKDLTPPNSVLPNQPLQNSIQLPTGKKASIKARLRDAKRKVRPSSLRPKRSVGRMQSVRPLNIVEG